MKIVYMKCIFDTICLNIAALLQQVNSSNKLFPNTLTNIYYKIQLGNNMYE